jgi:hypothetical protein
MSQSCSRRGIKQCKDWERPSPRLARVKVGEIIEDRNLRIEESVFVW